MTRPYNFVTFKQEQEIVEAIQDFVPPKEIAQKLNIPASRVRGVYRRHGIRVVKGNGRFKRGHAPHNKGMKGFNPHPATQFKKGHTPKNTRPVGSIRITKDGYKEIKYKEHKWRSLHSHVWILQNGEIPKGHVVIFKEGADKMNFTINDLLLVSRAELVKINKYGLLHTKKNS